MIYITGDTHGKLDIKKLFNPENYPDGFPTEKDYLIIAGDFGLLFDQEQSFWEDYYLSSLFANPWTTLFIDGNHENFERLKAYPERLWHGGKVSFIKSKIIWLKRGQIYNIEGKKIFTLGGGTSIDKGMRTPYLSWWPDEDISYADCQEAYKNLEKENFKVDYVITHAAPRSYAEKLFNHFHQSYFDDKNSDTLEQIKDCIVDFKHWYFGHYHIDYKSKEFTALYDSILRIE